MVSEIDGMELPFRGCFREVVELERLVQTFEDPGNSGNADVELLTTTLTDLGGGKTQAVYQTGHLPEEEYAKIETGVHGFYDRLAEHLEQC